MHRLVCKVCPHLHGVFGVLVVWRGGDDACGARGAAEGRPEQPRELGLEVRHVRAPLRERADHLAKDQQRRVDADRLLEPQPRDAALLHLLAPRQVDHRQV
eukprot:2021446-Pleurochrysis_carterae.AAC.1